MRDQLTALVGRRRSSTSSRTAPPPTPRRSRTPPSPSRSSSPPGSSPPSALFPTSRRPRPVPVPFVAGHSVGRDHGHRPRRRPDRRAGHRPSSATRGRAMAAASAVTPTGMSAVLGGDPDEVLAAIEAHGLTPANVNGAGQVVAAGTLEQLEALRGRPAGQGPGHPAAGRRRLPHRAHVPRRRGARRGRPRGHARRPRRSACSPTPTAPRSPTAPTRSTASSDQVSNPVRWDRCMETMLALGVTGLVELAPAGTLVGLAKRAMPGVETVAVKTPDDLEAARTLIAATQARDGSLTSAPPRQGAGSWRGPRRDGRPRPRTTPAPIHDPPEPSPSRRPHVTSPSATAPTPKGTGTLVDNGAPRHSRIMGVGAYRPARVVMNSEIVDKIDSSDEWIRERSGIISRHCAADDESVIDMAEAASRQALEQAGVAPEQIGFVLVATVTHPYQTPAAAPELASRLGSTAPALDISAACAGYCYGVGHGQRHGPRRLGRLRPRRRRREALRLHRPVRPRHAPSSSATGPAPCVIGPTDTPGIGPTVWGSDGTQRDAISQKQAWTDVRESLAVRAGRQARVAGDRHGRPDGLPLGRLGHGPGRPAGHRRRRHHGRRPRRLHPAPGEHAHHRRDGQAAQAARPTSRSPATS